MKAIIISMKNALLISKSLRGIKYAKEVVGGGSEDTTKKVQKTCPPARSSFRSLQG